MLRHLLIILLYLALTNLFTQCTTETKSEIALPTNTFRAGDIVFRRGEGLTSEFVLYNDPHGNYSHVGMLVNTDNGLMVVHAVPGSHPTQQGTDVVRIETASEFFAPENATRGAVMRLPLDSTRQIVLSQLALNKVGTDFDHQYNLQDTTQLYCTELLQHLYQKVGINLAEERITTINIPGLHTKVIMPADIYANKQLKSVFTY